MKKSRDFLAAYIKGNLNFESFVAKMDTFCPPSYGAHHTL